MELDVKGKDGHVSRKAVNIRQSSDLFKLSGERELYEGYVLSGIDCTPGMEQIEFSNTEVLPLGKAIGDVDENVVKRAQIRRTIEAHLDKELRYTEKGIKVLSNAIKIRKKRTSGTTEMAVPGGILLHCFVWDIAQMTAVFP